MIHELDNQQLRQLISGNFSWHQCIECNGLGWYWYSNVTGEQVSECGVDSLDYDKGCCEVCDGLGGTLTIGQTGGDMVQQTPQDTQHM